MDKEKLKQFGELLKNWNESLAKKDFLTAFEAVRAKAASVFVFGQARE